MEEFKRCSGHCCHSFPLSTFKTVDDIKNKSEGFIQEEINFWVENAIELGNGEFTCKQFDKEKGNCMAYDRRPNTCKNYPEYRSGMSCKYKECTRRVTYHIIET